MTLQLKHPKRPLSHLIIGDIFFLQNQPEKAGVQYQETPNTGKKFSKEVAHALMGLGRIGALNGKTNEALAYYQKAKERLPDNRDAIIGSAVLLAEEGKYQQSLEVLRGAEENVISGPMSTALMNEIQRRLQWTHDCERQQRIDQLVGELIKRIETADTVTAADDWSSEPLTVWLMDFESQGPVMQEGIGLLIHSALMEKLLQNSRVQVVERGLMDKLMEELRLGPGKLAAENTTLTLGKIAAAKVIVAGQLIQQGVKQQVIFRLIETESGQIFGFINQFFDPSDDASVSVRS